MRITNSGRGIHVREVKGVDRFKSDLPSRWYGFTNLDLVLGVGKSREIDVVIVSDKRIYFVDLKDWHGRIESVDGRWRLNGVDKDSSPVAKITDIARSVVPLLTRELKKYPETRDLPLPRIEGLVVLTGKADRSGIAETERQKVMTADEFIKIVKDDKLEWKSFGNIASEFLSRPLTDVFWKERLGRFFNVATSSSFRPGSRRFGRFQASDVPSFEHPNEIYREYEASEEGNKNNLGTLRLWDFTRCADARFQTEEGRQEIAGREQQVYHWLRDRSEQAEQTLLTPKIDDPERGVRYWEVYDRRRRLQRLASFAQSEAGRLLPAERVELARQVLSCLASLHRHDAAHLDLGGHSIWLETPTTVKFSHLLAARFPEVRTLGNSRYQFLASVGVPEDVLGVDNGPKCRDVFLAGVAIHQLLFGDVPRGQPPEWDPDIDAKGEFAPLHHWFSQALELDPASRFPDALVALNAFNQATASRPTSEEVIAGLERFRGTIRSQRQLVSAYPTVGDSIVESDRVDIWRSGEAAGSVLVKLWKQAAWGDLKREGAAILAFLERAADMKLDRPSGLPTVKEVIWLGDALAVVQEWIEGPTLAQLLDAPTDQLRSPMGALLLLQRLITVIVDLHERGIAHGDIKPANVVIASDGNPVFIDAIDFSPRVDGELMSSAYAPQSGSRFERDRFALTKIAEELFSFARFEAEDAARLAKAVRVCREKEPPLATIQPLLDAIEETVRRLDSPVAEAADALPREINISIAQAATGTIAPDEGFLFLRVRRDAERGLLSLIIRGACEEVAVRLDKQGKALFARRRPLEQRYMKWNAAQEFHQIDTVLTVGRSDLNDLSSLHPLLNHPAVKQRIDEAIAGEAIPAPADPEEALDLRLSEEQAEEALAEEVAALPTSIDLSIDVPKLWRALIDVENELTIEGTAQLDSYFDRATGRHKVPVELETGVFEFARNDTVGVLRQDRKGRWRRIGELDVQLSRPELAVINTSDLGSPNQGRLIDAGQRLRFVSHFEVQSLRRRTDAVDRILAGNGRSRDLLSVFDTKLDVSPTRLQHQTDEQALAGYELNPDQKIAFDRILNSRPVGLLQGPPGTGKTRFIAALTHYAITKGLARNVLVASQSHEAVNTAAEAVLTLFRKTGGLPSLLRVAMDEDVVSAPLRSFHTAKVEQSLKDRFRASFRDRLAVAGEALGLPDRAIDDIASLELSIRPIAARIVELLQGEERDEQRLNGLVETANRHLEQLELGELLSSKEVQDWPTLAERAAQRLMARHARAEGINADRADRLCSAAAVGRDFVGTVSRIQRSFESFLAGTRQIVVGTCVGLGRTSLGLTSTAFDLVVVDEAARCTASELLVPLQAARWVVLVGDHAQLEPHHKPEVINQVAERTGIAKREIQRSDFERVFSTAYGTHSGARLKTQYRMWPPIGQLVSETFYPDLVLEPGRTEPEIDPSLLPAGLDKPLTWIETDGLGEAAFDRREDEGSSRINRVEADTIIALLEDWHAHESFREWLVTQQKHPAGIGVICMYAAQRDLVRRKLRQSPLAYLLDQHVKVGTVDSYQGKENPVVILSLVRNNDGGRHEGSVKCIQEGFLSTPNRVNVAASRAMDRLVIVGARKRWANWAPLGRLAAGFERQMAAGAARAVGAETLLDQDASGTKVKPGHRPTRAGKTAGGSHG
jgi:serine/threonine protein kinase